MMQNLRRLPDILCCSTVYENSILLAVLCAVGLLLKGRLPLMCLCGVVTVWYLRTGDRSWIAAALVMSLMFVPHWSNRIPVFRTGRVSEVHSSYIIAVSGRTKALIYTDAPIEPDSVIEVNGAWQRITSVPSFYGFDFQQYCNERGVYWQLQGDVRQIRKSYSIRGLLYRRILSVQQPEQDILLQVLFGIRSDEVHLSSYLAESGFAVSGLLSLLDHLMKLFLYPDTRRRHRLGITFVLALVFHFPLALGRRLITALICRDSDMRNMGIAAVLVMLLYPYCMHSASFLFPMMFYLISRQTKDRKEKTLFFSGLMQCLLFQRVNPLEALLYGFLHPLNGFFWALSLLYLFVPLLSPAGILKYTDHCLSLLRCIDLNGSLIGAGFPFFVLICLSLKGKQQWKKRLILLYAFLLTGLFHPFPEVTFINVGQGDSILLRRPLNLSSILIDTGKPEAWNHLDDLLKGKGIRKLESLIITHPDLDHNGNQEALTEEYIPSEVITEHFDLRQYRSVIIRDLSTIVSGDKNQSSLFLHAEINGMSFLIAGDADQYAETEVIRNYPGLHADVLKVNHHGSATSSADIFLDTLRPDLAVISCGAYSIYHHPSPETVQKLLKRHIPYFVTRESGDISIVMIGPLHVLITAAGEFSLLSSSG